MAFISFVLFIVLIFVVCSILGRLRESFAQGVPRAAGIEGVDLQGFAVVWWEA
jgi:hypothetical protein